jgi:hypothetical protein
MADIIDAVDVNVSADSAPVTVEAFGTGLFLSRHSVFSGIREYPGLTEVSADFPQGTPEYDYAAAYFSQEPSPNKLKIANNPVARNWSCRIDVISVPAPGTVVSVNVVDSGGTLRTGSYTVLPLDTLATVAAGLHAALDPLPGIATVYTVTETFFSLSAQGATGAKLRVSSIHSALRYLDTDTNGSYPTRLTELALIDSDFYGVGIDATDDTNITAVAAWVEANKRFFFAVTFNTREQVTGSGVLGLALVALGYRRMELRISKRGARVDGAMASEILANGWDNGTAPTFAFRSLIGVETDTFTPTELSYLLANRVQVFVVNKGRRVTWEGKTPGGRYADVTVFLDWLEARIGEAVFSKLSDEPRLGYTTDDIGKMEDKVWEVLSLARDRKGFSPDFPLTIESPTPSSVGSVDRGNRVLGGGGIRFSGTFAGAFHKVRINGNVAV